MNKIIVPIGISASGKSTFASQYVEKNPNTIIVSRDSLRMSLFGYTEENLFRHYNVDNKNFYEREKIVTDFHTDQIWYALQKNFDVIADNTHLRRSHITAYKSFGVPLEIKVLEAKFNDASNRDVKRKKSVGDGVLVKQSKQFEKIVNSGILDEIETYNKDVVSIFQECRKKPNEFGKPECVIFDVDGTLSIKGDRDTYDYSKVHLDTINHSVGTIFKSLRNGFHGDTIICSGRDDVCLEETSNWLVNHKLYHEYIYLRKTGDTRKDWMIKAEFWKEIQNTYNIVSLIDDRDQVVRIGRRLGYDVHQVNYGDF